MKFKAALLAIIVLLAAIGGLSTRLDASPLGAGHKIASAVYTKKVAPVSLIKGFKNAAKPAVSKFTAIPRKPSKISAAELAASWAAFQNPPLTIGAGDQRYVKQSAAVTNISGLSRWFQAVPAARIPDIGGRDVVIIGDSIFEGATAWTSTATYRTDRWDRFLMRRLQDRYNPDYVLGGYGFVPVRRGDNVSLMTPTGAEQSAVSPNPPTFPISYNDNGQGTAARNQRITSDGTSRYVWQMDGSGGATSQYNRTLVSAVEMLGRRGSSYPIARVDVGTGSAPTIGSGGVLATTVTTAGSGTYGRHFGVLGSGTISTTANNYFSFAGAASGNDLYLDGAIFYNGDEATGIRVHNLANYGTSTPSQDPAQNSGSWEATTQFFQTAPTDTTTTGASRGALLLINFITNDIGSAASPAITLSAYLTSLSNIIDAALVLPSRPSVCIVIPPPRGGINQTNAETNYRVWLPAIKALAIQKGVCVIDLWAALANDHRTSGLPDLLGFNDMSDNLHFTKAYQGWMAEYVFRILTSQDFYTIRVDDFIAQNNYAFEG